jgi:hypothetical protein
MATTRQVNTKLWNDEYVHALSPTDKLVFVYLLTNSHTNLAGIYELPLHTGASELGVAVEVFGHSLMRLQDKARYIDGWMVLKNFVRHQSWRNDKVRVGIERILADVPAKVLAGALKDDWYWLPPNFGKSYPQDSTSMSHAYPMHRVSDRVSKRGSKPSTDRVSIPYDRTPFTIDLDYKRSGVTPENSESYPQGYPQPPNKGVESDMPVTSNQRACPNTTKRTMWQRAWDVFNQHHEV